MPSANGDSCPGTGLPFRFGCGCRDGAGGWRSSPEAGGRFQDRPGSRGQFIDDLDSPPGPCVTTSLVVHGGTSGLSLDRPMCQFNSIASSQ